MFFFAVQFVFGNRPQIVSMKEFCFMDVLFQMKESHTMVTSAVCNAWSIVFINGMLNNIADNFFSLNIFFIRVTMKLFLGPWLLALCTWVELICGPTADGDIQTLN